MTGNAQFPGTGKLPPDGGNGGSRLDRLERQMDEQIRATSQIGQTLAKLDERSIHAATKAWVLGGVLGGMAIAAGVAATIVRLFMQ